MGSFFSEILGGVTGGALDIVGGQLSAAQNRQAMRASADLQREFAQHGIQWRVEDAKRAGLHPLAALGVFPSSASPVAIGDVTHESFSRAGQDISRAISAGSSRADNEMAELNKSYMAAQIKESEARRMAIESDIAVKRQSPVVGVMPEDAGSTIIGQSNSTPGQGLINLTPPQIMTHTKGDSSVQSGVSPNLERVMVHPRFPMLMPAARGQESTWELWAELPAYEKWGIVMRNAGYYGEGWLKDFFRVQYLGQEPVKDWSQVKGAYPQGMMRAPSDASGAWDSMRREIEKFKDVPRRYEKWSREHPSGRR